MRGRVINPGGTVPAAIPGRALLGLMAGFALLIAPQWERLPIWLMLACVSLAGWRWLAQRGRLRLPGRWHRVSIMVLLTGVYALTVQGRFSVDTAASFFVLAVGLKWLETRSSRDFYVLFFILTYLAAVNLLFQQGIAWATITLAGVLVLLLSLQLLNGHGMPGGLASSWRRMGWMLLKTLPIVVLLFVFFPRMAPLWSVPLVSEQARTGISDSMTPGDISSLAQSSERAFRATFGGEVPAFPQRYWRGLILDRYDGRTWDQRDRPVFERPGPVSIEGSAGEPAADQYDVLLEATNQRWAFALDNSRAVSPNVTSAPGDLFRFRRPADTSVRYRMQRQPAAVSPGDTPALGAGDRRRYLQLPSAGNDRARRLAQTLQAASDDRGVIRAILERFHQQNYFYTLRPPRMGDDSVDTLLFDEKRGFCAHYAGATAYLLRAAGIPARVVVGYQGGSAGAGDEYLIIRQYDAHAWVEAWLPESGWVRVDPTAAIAPQRIESGLRDAVAGEGSFLENDWTSPQRYGDIELLQWASLQLDRVNYHWQRWVVGYQGQTQMVLMSRLPGGLGMRELGYLTAALVAVTLLLAGLVTAWRDRRGRGQDASRRLLDRWQRLLGRYAVGPEAGDTPVTTARRAARHYPELEKPAMAFARGINRHYYEGTAKAPSVTELHRLRWLLNTTQRLLKQRQRRAFFRKPSKDSPRDPSS